MENLTRAQRCRKLLHEEEFADITFLVGQHKIPIRANKRILQFASNVFYKLFSYTEKEQNAYDIPELEPEAFKMLLDYFYTGEFNHDSYDASIMLKGATLYGAVDVIHHSVQKLIGSLNIISVASTLVLAIETQNFELEKAALEFICKPFNAHQIFKPSFEFFTFTETALLKILQRNDLAVDEIDLFCSIVKWGKHELAKNLGCNIKEANYKKKYPKELRLVLENLIPLIRFPLMKPSDFSTKVEPTKLLCDQEVMAILLYFNVEPGLRASYRCTTFNSKPRAKSYSFWASCIFGRR